MALFSVENVGEWSDGGFIGALVIAPNARVAYDLVAQGIASKVDPKNLKVTRESTAGTRLLWSGFND